MHDKVPDNVQQDISIAENKVVETLVSKRSRQSGHKIVRNILRILLVLLCLIGFALSVLPWGRAIARSALLLPALITASQFAPLVANGGNSSSQANDGSFTQWHSLPGCI